MSLSQLFGDFFPGQILVSHENHHVVKEITDLILEFVRVRVLGGDDDLRGLLSYLFEDLVDPLVKQIVGIRSFFGMVFAIQDGLIYFIEDLERVPGFHIFLYQVGEEAGPITGVTGCPDLGYLSQDGIFVAVDGE